MHITSFEDFKELAQRGTFVPVYKEIVADLLTPVSAFLKIAEHSDYAFLLESVEGGEQVARYSFLGKDPFLILRSRGGKTIIERAGATTESEQPFIATLRELMAGFHAPFVPGLPRFTGGAVGYLGYDAAAWFEPVTLQPTPDVEDEAGFMMFDTVLAFDHVRHRILIIANARITGDEDLESLYQFARARIEFVERELDRTLSRPPHSAGPAARRDVEHVRVTSSSGWSAPPRNTSPPATSTRSCCRSGSRRRWTPIRSRSIARCATSIPSPYMYFLRVGDRSIVGSSPEMLVRVEGRKIQTHPIAGTRPRGRNEEEDVRLAEELKRNEKERAEHVMLVDLGRNDVGRVAAYGSVRVPTYMTLERYSHVMHLVSVVEGRLDDRHDRLDALVACFPAGTVSGAPKVRAMEIIAELENRRRGVYAGAVGYVDFAGNLDFCITIRTVVIENGRAYVQAGAGIVADSNPDGRVRGDEGQGARRDAGAGTGAGGFIGSLMVLVIDNYDSFTYNLVQYLGELGAEIRVRRNDEVTIGEVEAMAPEQILISPGPGRPEDAGVSVDVIRRFGPTTPILGVCLGHQAIGIVYGGTVCRATAPMHGKTSTVVHDGKGLFHGITEPFPAGRYHSLVISGERVPAELEVVARTKEDGTIMAVRHRSYPVHGVQFHPESVLTDEGRRILRNFLDL